MLTVELLGAKWTVWLSAKQLLSESQKHVAYKLWKKPILRTIIKVS